MGGSILIALGANIGDPPGQLRTALDRLRGCITVRAVSDVYLTDPVGMREQPPFLNMVVRGDTKLGVNELHRRLISIEDDMGRTRDLRYGPRPIDIDLLAVGDLVLESSTLVIPHPRMHERSFVLVPLVEIAADWRHPGLGLRADELLRNLGSPTAVRRIGPLAMVADPE